MFASTYSSRSLRGLPHSDLYQQVGVESRVLSATPHALVSMLFEGFLDAVTLARRALQTRDVAAKGQAIARAVRIIDEGLRAGLDLKAGGSLAQDLHDLYGYLTMRLTLANVRNDDEALAECQRLMRPLHEAWVAIGPQVDRG